MMSEGTATSPSNTFNAPSNSTPNPSSITRAGKACEPCRIRKTRCNIAVQAVCSECLKREIAGECKIREKARPNRPSSQKRKTLPASPDDHSYSASPAQHDHHHRQHHEQNPPYNLQDGESYSHESNYPGPSRSGWATPVRSHHPQTSANEHGSQGQGMGQISASAMVEAILDEQVRHRYGLELTVGMAPENIFNPQHSRYLNLSEIGLDPSLPGAHAQAQGWINTHFRAIHHGTPFLHLPHVLGIASKLFDRGAHPHEPISNDELALLYAVLALGSLREQTYDSETGQYRTLATTMTIDDLLLGFGASPIADQPGSFQSGSVAQSLFRLAQEELEQTEQPSETAVQALFLLHMFVSNTSMGRRSRDYVARAVMMSHELGLNRRLPKNLTLSRLGQGQDEHATRQRSMLYLYVYFSDVYLSALESHPPLIKRHDYDPDVFAPIYLAPSGGIDTPSGTPISGLRDFVDLVTSIGGVLERLHTGYHADSMPSIESILQLDKEMEDLRERLGTTFNPDLRPGGNLPLEKRTATAGSLLRQIHYNWSRIALRAPSLKHPLLRHSSLAICARSALSILLYHRHVIDAGLLNLPWMQLRRIATSIYIVFIALWAGEIPHVDAEAAVSHTLNVLCVICTRWKSATTLARTVVQLADASGLSFERPQDNTLLNQSNNMSMSNGNNVSWDMLGQVNTMPNLSENMGMNLPMAQNMDWNALGNDGEMFTAWQSLHQPPW